MPPRQPFPKASSSEAVLLWPRYTNSTRTPSDNFYNFFLNDGVFVSVGKPANSKTGKSAAIYIDINGKTKPNKLGRDIFYYIYWIENYDNKNVSGKFVPYGGRWSREEIINGNQPYNCNKNKTGELCAALIMQDGWQIKDDYPW